MTEETVEFLLTFFLGMFYGGLIVAILISLNF